MSEAEAVLELEKVEENQQVAEQVAQSATLPEVGPIALIAGQPFEKLPDDLYIPPEALRVFLEAFQGPLDLLLYLIRRHNIDILDIPIAEITRQYMEYVDLMKDLHLDLAGEYLVMAAMLAEIKSRMLLPKPPSIEEEEGDPRAQLVRRLQEYERFKQATENLDHLPRYERDIFPVKADVPELEIEKPLPDVEMKDLLFALQSVMKRAQVNASHHIKPEILSTRERMSVILEQVKDTDFMRFENLFDVKEGRMGVVVTFIAILELLKQAMIEIIQAEPYTPIHVRAAA